MRKKTSSSKTPQSKPPAVKADLGAALAGARPGTLAHVFGAAQGQERGDGWQSVITGIGVAQRDKRLGSTFEPDCLSQQELENIWRGDDMAARIIETQPSEMLREGFEVKIQPAPSPAPAPPGAALEDGDDVEPADEEAEDAVEGDSEEAAPDGVSTDELQFAKKRADAFPGAAKGKPQGKPAFGAPGASKGQKPGFGAMPGLPPAPTKPPGPIKREDDDAKKQSEAVTAQLEDLGVHERLLEALNYERAFGGAGILVGADDGQDMRLPLDLERVKSVKWLTVLSSFELCPVRYYSNPAAAKYGEPEIFRIQPSTYVTGTDFSSGDVTTPTSAPKTSSLLAEVHESRILRFTGVRTSRQQMLSNVAPGWGDSVLVRCNRVLSDFHLSWGSAAVLLSDFAQAVFKIKDLAQLIATDRDDVVIRRAQLIDMMRSTVRGVLLDSEEEFERKSTPIAGLEGLLQQLAIRLSAAADMPVTLLMGQAPAGLNATGASDTRFFYDKVAAGQKSKLKPKIERLLKILFAAKDGPTAGKEPENWSVKFNPLWQESGKEQAETRQIQSVTDKNYIDAGVVTPEEIAASRFGGDDYSTDTVLDFEARDTAIVEHEAALVEHEAQSKEAAKQLAKAPKGAAPPGANPFAGPPKAKA
jgi:phage-related protein (TIGR01555 family)